MADLQIMLAGADRERDRARPRRATQRRKQLHDRGELTPGRPSSHRNSASVGVMPEPLIGGTAGRPCDHRSKRRSAMQIRGLGSSLRLGGMALVLLGGVSGAQAGFFERLFGTESEPEQPRQYQPAPAQDEGIDVQPGRRRSLDFSVRPRRERAVRRERPRREIFSAGSR